jgi:hypothetical protein
MGCVCLTVECDNKMVNLKRAMTCIRDEMKNEDRLGVVTFDDQAKVLHQLLRMNEATKARVGAAMAGIHPGTLTLTLTLTQTLTLTLTL